MERERANIIAQLRKDVLFQRFSLARNNKSIAPAKLYPFDSSFPLNRFPLGEVHEFICPGEESFSASAAFISGLLSSLNQINGPLIWISSKQKLFPPSFTTFGIRPDKIFFIILDKPKDILWTMEEALRCEGLSAVVCDVRELSFKQSRRLQLATEQSRVTGFVLRNKPKSINTTACATRWMVTPIQGRRQRAERSGQRADILRDVSAVEKGSGYLNDESLPGIGHPGWNVQLLKVKNGKPDQWKISWYGNKFIHEEEQLHAITIHQKKAV